MARWARVRHELPPGAGEGPARVGAGARAQHPRAVQDFYLLDSAPGRLFLHPQLHMVNLGNRAAVVYSQNDLAGAWERDESGAYAYEVSPGGEPQRELAVRVGINVCMYALCLDYKDDAVHLPLILKKRR